MFSRCPKCGHTPLPRDQSLPAACPACGVILAKLARAATEAGASRPFAVDGTPHEDDDSLLALITALPDAVDPFRWKFSIAMLAAFAVWGLRLIALDYTDGEINQSFIHGPLLVFHEAGHVVFRIFGEWISVLGGTLGQLIMPAVLAGALLWKNRDPFGASIGLWLLGVSVLDVAPYMYDALHPQLMLLSGTTGEEGGHDWIYLFGSLHLLPRSQGIGAATHALGTLIVLISLGWGAWVLKLQRGRLAVGPP